MICPNCGTDSKFDTNKGTETASCRSCSGILVPETVLAKMVPALVKFAEAPEGSPKIAQLPESPRTCGSCGVRYRLLKHQDVELDFCPRCRSVWFDANELEKVSPGMKKSAAAQASGSGDGGSGAGSGVADVAGEIALGIIGGVISGIFESIFD